MVTIINICLVIAAIFCLLAGIFLLAKETYLDWLVQHRVKQVHTDFLLESLKNKRD